jgi:hypothetical protein
MVRHQQPEPAMPGQFVVIVGYRGENTIADIRSAQLIFPRRHAFDGDEKPASLSHPLWDGMWQPFPDR